jgi:hypothetical protein
MLYDHLPGILAGYPAVLFAILAVLSLFTKQQVPEDLVTELEKTRSTYVESVTDGDPMIAAMAADSEYQLINERVPRFNSHMLFWIGLTVMLVWYVAFRFNMPKDKFVLMSALLGTFVGIPVILELTGYLPIFSIAGSLLGGLEPSVNTGAWVVMSLVFFCIWLGNFIYSRTHMKVRIDESGLTLNRLGGKGERFELIGLKTENEPLDYLELFLAGVGSLSLKTRMNKPIFTMKRVIGLYWTPLRPFSKGKLALIEEMLSHQGSTVSVDRQERLDAAEAADAAGEDADDITGEELDGGEAGGGKNEAGIS